MPVTDAQQFVLAVNNYRQSGGGGFPAVSTAPVVYNRQNEIRQLLIDWVLAHGTIDPAEFASSTGGWSRRYADHGRLRRRRPGVRGSGPTRSGAHVQRCMPGSGEPRRSLPAEHRPPAVGEGIEALGEVGGGEERALAGVLAVEGVLEVGEGGGVDRLLDAALGDRGTGGEPAGEARDQVGELLVRARRG